jgi:hypothetical protein
MPPDESILSADQPDDQGGGNLVRLAIPRVLEERVKTIRCALLRTYGERGKPLYQQICNQQVIGSNPIAGSFATRADSQAIKDPKNTIKNGNGRTKVALKINLL